MAVEEQINEEFQSVIRHAHTGNDSPQIRQEDLDGPIKDITQDQVDALDGTGTPNSTNKYVTNDDVADDGTASKIVRLDASSQATINETPTADTHAASKGYVDDGDDQIMIAVASNTVQYRDQTETSCTGWDTRKSAIVRLPGVVRVKIRVKTSSGPNDLYWVVAGPNDEDDGGNYFAANGAYSYTQSINNTTYEYYQKDVRVRAGDEVGIFGGQVVCEDFQMNFTPTLTSTYVIEGET